MSESILITDAALMDKEDAGITEEDDSLLFVKPKKKHKILMISDHQLSTSGVGVQSRILIDGLIATGKYSFRCLGAAIKHADYNTIQVNPDFIVKPIDGFGNKQMLRQLLFSEQPDAILIFTDPRQFTWLWEMEDEIRQICPITYWHVWDNGPYPEFNNPWYESTDLINCLSKQTYDLVKPRFPEKTHYIPHAFPESIYHTLPKDVVEQHKQANFGPKKDFFKVLWVNRNAIRKMPADLLMCWKQFLEELKEKHGHDDAVLVMHTDPHDQEGPNLLAVAEALGLQDKVWFSTEKISFENMNVLHNVVDCCINISKAEGFGLMNLISLQVGKPIIALKTGGETSKVIDETDGFEHGVAIEPIKKALVGSQMVPYIYEDYAGTQDVVDAFMKIYELSPEKKKEIETRSKAFVRREFNVEDVVSKWDRTLEDCISSFKETKNSNRWALTEVVTKAITVQTQPNEQGTIKAVQNASAEILNKASSVGQRSKKKNKQQRKRKAKVIKLSSIEEDDQL